MTNGQKTLRVTVDAGSTQKQRGRPKKLSQSNLVQNDGSVRAMLPIDTLSRLLSERNIDLLKLIKTQQPNSVAELARLSGRPKASLTLTLRRLEQCGIVVFKAASGRRKIPTVACDKLMLEVSINP